MVWLPVVKSVSDLIQHGAMLVVFAGLIIAVVKDSLPHRSLEGKLMRGGLIVSGAAIAIGFIAEHVK